MNSSLLVLDTVAHYATLLTRNTVDFAKGPGLRFENWLD